MKTPKEVAGQYTRADLVKARVSAALDSACLDGRVTEKGGSFEVADLTVDDHTVVRQHLINYHWENVVSFVDGTYKIKVTPSPYAFR